MLWKIKPELEQLNKFGENTLLSNLGIEITEIGDDYLIAKMPVDARTVQPARILHGGASVALAESLGSYASSFCIADNTKKQPVGIDINATHLSSAREGTFVYGKVTPLRIGRTMHFWQIDITNEEGKLVCVSRLTVAIVER